MNVIRHDYIAANDPRGCRAPATNEKYMRFFIREYALAILRTCSEKYIGVLNRSRTGT